MGTEDGKIFQEVDMFAVLREIGQKNKALQAIVLQEVEKYVTDPDEFALIRSAVLDAQNSYTRSIVRLIFGDIEFLNFSKR